VLIPLLVRRTLGAGAQALGLVLATSGLGGAIASLAVGWFGAPERRVSAMWAAWGLSGACVVGLALAANVVVAGLVALAVFGLLMYGNVLWGPLVQSTVPRNLLGRVSSLDYLFSLGLSPVGVLLAGVLATAIGIRTTILVGGVVAALSACVVVLPGMRDPERHWRGRTRSEVTEGS